jgi:hypothetical protein
MMLKAEHRQIRVQLVGMARALKSGVTERLERPATSEATSRHWMRRSIARWMATDC